MTAVSCQRFIVFVCLFVFMKTEHVECCFFFFFNVPDFAFLFVLLFCFLEFFVHALWLAGS